VAELGHGELGREEAEHGHGELDVEAEDLGLGGVARWRRRSLALRGMTGWMGGLALAILETSHLGERRFAQIFFGRASGALAILHLMAFKLAPFTDSFVGTTLLAVALAEAVETLLGEGGRSRPAASLMLARLSTTSPERLARRLGALP
jgi:hypothetical protein